MVLKIEGIAKAYETKQGVVQALKDINLVINKGEIFALIGESGSGKSTMAELITRLQKPSAGSIYWEEQNILSIGNNGTYRDIQVVFQNPDRSLNPKMKVQQLVEEPLLIHRVNGEERKNKVIHLLNMVGLSEQYIDRFPSQLSGGQKQRIAIARALALQPKLLIADEITSALDPITERQILNLLLELKEKHQMSILFITHNLDILASFADRFAVLQRGQLVETGAISQLFHQPKALYTKKLLDASLIKHPILREKRGLRITTKKEKQEVNIG